MEICYLTLKRYRPIISHVYTPADCKAKKAATYGKLFACMSGVSGKIAVKSDT